MSMNLPRTPRQQCRTPRRERPGQPSQAQQVPIEHVLQDASQFPVLSKTLLGRGRRGRRGDEPSRAQSLSRERPTREQPSQQGSSHADEPPKESSRSRAYSHDAGVDALIEKATPSTPRSSLKKSRDSGASDAGENPAFAKLRQEMQEKMNQMAALMGQDHVGMQLNLMLAGLPQESEAKAPAMPNEQETTPAIKACVRTSVDDAVEEVEVARPRRLSNPRPNLELPTGMSWEYPLTKNEKKARVVMISDIENDMLQDENAALHERLNMSPQDKA